MKKLFGVLVLMVSVSACAVSFDIGPRLGYRSYDEDSLDAGEAYGLQGSININDNMRVRILLDTYKAEESENVSWVYSYTWYTTAYRYWTTSDEYFIYTWRGTYNVAHTVAYNMITAYDYEYETMPLFFEYDYMWNFDKFDVFAGAGVGWSFNDASIDLVTTSDSEDGQAIADVMNSSISTSMELDDAFIYGVSAGFVYNINSSWDVTFEANYTAGEADVTVTSASSYSSAEVTDTWDMNNFSAFISANYHFGGKQS